MVHIFYLYDKNLLLKTFARLDAVVSFINNFKNSNKCNFEIYVEETNHDIDACSIRTLLYKDNMFEIDNIFNYY